MCLRSIRGAIHKTPVGAAQLRRNEAQKCESVPFSVFFLMMFKQFFPTRMCTLPLRRRVRRRSAVTPLKLQLHLVGKPDFHVTQSSFEFERRGNGSPLLDT